MFSKKTFSPTKFKHYKLWYPLQHSLVPRKGNSLANFASSTARKVAVPTKFQNIITWLLCIVC